MKTATQPTAGSWKAAGCAIYQADAWKDGRNIGGRYIASTAPENPEEMPSDEDIANAQLIAAAPELLRACRYALEIIQTAKRYFPKSIKNRDTFHLCNIEENSIRSAIRKATGGAQ